MSSCGAREGGPLANNCCEGGIDEQRLPQKSQTQDASKRPGDIASHVVCDAALLFPDIRSVVFSLCVVPEMVNDTELLSASRWSSFIKIMAGLVVVLVAELASAAT